MSFIQYKYDCKIVLECPKSKRSGAGQRFEQYINWHCGPAVVEMTLTAIQINHVQDAFALSAMKEGYFEPRCALESTLGFFSCSLSSDQSSLFFDTDERNLSHFLQVNQISFAM